MARQLTTSGPDFRICHGDGGARVVRQASNRKASLADPVAIGMGTVHPDSTTSMQVRRMDAPVKPRPPGVWRALARDACLNPEEAAARAAALAAVQHHVADRASGERELTPPRLKLSPYEPILSLAGWRVRITASRQRARIEASHPDGAAVMITAVSGRAGINGYVLYAESNRIPRWLAAHVSALKYFIEHRELPPGARRHHPRSPCRCTKLGRFPTEAWAKKALTEIMINKVLRRGHTATERRAYRCPDDDRMWHLTSSKRRGTPSKRGCARQATHPAPEGAERSATAPVRSSP